MKDVKKSSKLKEIKADKNKPKIEKKINPKYRKIMNVETEEFTPVEEQLKKTPDH